MRANQRKPTLTDPNFSQRSGSEHEPIIEIDEMETGTSSWLAVIAAVAVIGTAIGLGTWIVWLMR